MSPKAAKKATARPPTAQAWVLDELRRRISKRELRPGDQILADTFAEELGVSRVPVREALRILEGEGQVVHRPHRGYFVAEMRLAELEELYRIRHLLEAGALRQTVPALDSDAFAEFDEVLAELRAANETGDIGKHVEANRRFHWIFLQPLEAPRLERLIQSHYNYCDSYGALYYNDRENRDRSEREHLELIEAAREHDASRVIEILESHRANVIDVLREVLDEEKTASAAD
jgi:DNA-binding GntR family transcriptional regulator